MNQLQKKKINYIRYETTFDTYNGKWRDCNHNSYGKINFICVVQRISLILLFVYDNIHKDNFDMI